MSDDSLCPSPETQELRARAEQLYAEVRVLTHERRAAFLEEVCADDIRLRAELESLLDHAVAGEAFFERLAEVVTSPETVPGRSAVGHYRILSCVGVGGMGVVYRARDTRLDRDVALKFPPAHAGTGPDGVGRLWVEARAAAALEHPNVCTVYEVGASDEGRPFIAMAFYEGETLKQRLRRGPLRFADALDIAAQIARGLGAAHTHGILHRDVKPGNIMLTPDGTVKLLDFGLAKVADASLTRPGVTPGTVAYMSPEQVRGDPVVPRSDLWSLGVVLYEMITGVHPFRGGNDRALIQAILHERPEPVRKRAPGTPRSVERITERLLEKRPEDRYASVEQVLTELSAALPDRARAARLVARRPPARARKAPIALAGSLTIGIAGGGLWLVSRDTPPGTGTDAGIAPATSLAPVADSKTLAVLPFTDLNGDSLDDDFSDGLTEELIGTLSRVGALRVVARTSAFAFKGQSSDVREIGAALNVGAVVEGSVRRIGSNVRVEARLINVADGLHLWSEVYDRELTDIFAIQRDLALSIASALRTELTPSELERLGRPATANAEAFVLYLKGRHFWHQRTPIAYQRAIEYFQRAIGADSSYAAPYAGLAAVFAQQALSGSSTSHDARERSRVAAHRAVQLDDGLAEAHAVLGLYEHVFEWDPDAAERELLRAIELDPSYATARLYYGNLLAARGRIEEALTQKRRAVELDPLSPAQSESLAFTLLRAGRLDQALQQVTGALELDSMYWRAHAVLGLYNELTDRFDDAIHAYVRANELARAPVHRTRADIARALALKGRGQEARRLVAELKTEADASGIAEPSVATAMLALGDVDAAFAWLELGYAQRHPHLPFIFGDARFANLDVEPRFIDLMRRLGMRR